MLLQENGPNRVLVWHSCREGRRLDNTHQSYYNPCARVTLTKDSREDRQYYGISERTISSCAPSCSHSNSFHHRASDVFLVERLGLTALVKPGIIRFKTIEHVAPRAK